MTELNEIRETLKKHYDELLEKEVSLVSDYLVKKECEKKFKVPDDKIVLSAEMFSKIVNIISHMENNGSVDNGLLQNLLDDVKKNRENIESVTNKEINTDFITTAINNLFSKGTLFKDLEKNENGLPKQSEENVKRLNERIRSEEVKNPAKKNVTNPNSIYSRLMYDKTARKLLKDIYAPNLSEDDFSDVIREMEKAWKIRPHLFRC